MKIYTKTGDDGETGLFGGQRVAKDSPLIEACGALDELNAALGMALATCSDSEIEGIVSRIQGELFVAGADVATPILQAENQSTSTSNVPRVTPAMIARLESEIDTFADEAGVLTNFILPGGSSAGSGIHFARCVCRRAERVLVQASRTEPINRDVLVYINRLSDHLFEMARVANIRDGKPETIWSRDTVS